MRRRDLVIFDNLSEMFMVLGTCCPHHADGLFP